MKPAAWRNTQSAEVIVNGVYTTIFDSPKDDTMRVPSLLGHSAQLLRIITRSPQPSDRVTSEYLRERKYIGSGDRRFISEITFAAFRALSILEEISWSVKEILPSANADTAAASHPQEVVMLVLTLALGEEIGCLPGSAAIDKMAGDSRRQAAEDALEEHFPGVDSAGVLRTASESLAVARAGNNITAGWGISEEWIELLREDPLKRWESPESLCALGASLLSAAPLVLRVNTLLISRSALIDKLLAKGLEVRAGEVSPHAIICSERTALTETEEYKAGLFEIQDEASQLFAFAAAPQPGWLVLDACAGAGGKSLHLASLMENKGTVIASDIERNRLKEIYPRAYRAGVSCVQTRLVSPSEEYPHPDLVGECDLVVVDAPCSGAGTSRRMPATKWRIIPRLIDKLSARQCEILETAAQCVAPGGVLLYATCSLIPRENEAVSEEFLRRNADHFVGDPLGPVLEQAGVSTGKVIGNTLSVTPVDGGMDGFFIARFRRLDDSEVVRPQRRSLGRQEYRDERRRGDSRGRRGR